MAKPVQVSVKFIKESLGNPSTYLWCKCTKELGYPKRLRRLTLGQSKLILGWFFLYAQHKEDRSEFKCLAAYQAGATVKSSRFLVPVMTGKEILALKDRPSNSTLYRRGLKHNQSYNPSEVERLMK